MPAVQCVSMCVCVFPPELLFLQVLDVIFVENGADLCLHLLSLLNGIHNHIITLEIRQNIRTSLKASTDIIYKYNNHKHLCVHRCRPTSSLELELYANMLLEMVR